ncbi:6,7-dimethyl-8-ribityllumazine synthase [Nocardia mexicana]|uniref:6,7-dimethyl-8-ribityllumazine synthase n=1 Tax=Nocardia mexicana TaxID=279262 RepID=A0A370H3X9_9NOCA|nr:6,7-dimethyl-8-ribityllumazine synthase [Nocardia mexicana]RDI50900.1 6,7-dimethyl-8-ribityllumazine synthase [Nocardia mexicana]
MTVTHARRVVVVASTWHDEAAGGLIRGAEGALGRAGVDYSLVRVSSTFHLPVVVKTAARSGADAVVALGVIVRGNSPRFEFFSEAVTSGLMAVAVETGTPVGFGVLIVDDEAQAHDRAGFADSRESKGWESAESALDALRACDELRAASGGSDVV